ncbi:MAG: hypothetical protein L3K13_01090 [Thermoplasmata archaeon]|nr:hypothetical protein [Thermoplasmata archaeon]
MIAARLRGPPELLLLGVVRGVVAEVAPMLEELHRYHPTRLAIAIGPEELTSYTEQFVNGSTEPVAPLLPTETAEVLALAKFGEVRVPHAPFITALRWASENGVAVAPVDPDEEEYSNLFAEKIGYWELVRRTVRERGAARAPPKAGSVDEFALRWSEQVGHGRASRRFESARSERTVAAARTLAQRGERVALLADRERIPELERQLSGEPTNSRRGG